MGTISRLRYVVAANVNALIEKAEDPEKLLRALVREMEDAAEEARLAGAEMMSEQRQLERLTGQLAEESEEWQRRAETALGEDREDLARAALLARQQVDARRQQADDDLQVLVERLAHMEKDVATLKQKQAEAKQKLRSQIRRPAAGNPSVAIPESRTEKRMQRAMGRFETLQARVDSLEARVRSYEVGGPAPAVWNETATPANPEVEEQLNRLKAKLASAENEPTAKDDTGSV